MNLWSPLSPYGCYSLSEAENNWIIGLCNAHLSLCHSVGFHRVSCPYCLKMDIIFLLLFSSTTASKWSKKLLEKSFNLRKAFFSGASYLNVTSIIGRNAEIPCELTPKSKTDNAYLVLWWFHDIFGTPIYRLAYLWFYGRPYS